MRIIFYKLLLTTKDCLRQKPVYGVLYGNARAYCVATENNATLHKTVAATTTTTTTKAQEPEAKPLEERSLNIAVIGVPNAGKSTFINNIINHRVCPTSSKVHTTRKFNNAIYTIGNTQLVFCDTPGLVTPNEIKKHNLDQAFKSAYRHAIQHADIIAVLQDVSNAWTRKELHSTVMDTLNTYKKLPSLLILNKIDALKSKRILLDLIRTLTNNTLSRGRKQRQVDAVAQTDNADKPKRDVGWSHFEDVFLVSSLTGSGLHELQEYLVRMAKERAWQFPGDSFTDEQPESLIVESVRARLLDYLPQEIPYNLQCAIEFYNVEKNTIYASVRVTCPTERIERLICGISDGKLRQITERVTSDLVETFGKPISLTISTISKKTSN